MATFRDILNRAKIHLGDDEIAAAVSELTDPSDKKLREQANDILEEVEAAAQWRCLRQRITATVTANEVSASLSGVNERSRVWYVYEAAYGREVPLVFDVTDSSNQYRLCETDLAELLRRDQNNSNSVDGSQPEYFAISPTATGLDIYVYPRSSTERTIELDLVVPQARLGDADLDTTVKVPATVVVLGTTWWAMEERGEELGPQGQAAQARFERELAARAAQEMAAQGMDELIPG